MSELIDREDLSELMTQRLVEIRHQDARKALFEIALTTAAVDLAPSKKYHERLKELGRALGIEYAERDLERRIKHLRS